jgi:hypothetical protein
MPCDQPPRRGHSPRTADGRGAVSGITPARTTHRAKAWAKLMSRVGEEFPLQCPSCSGNIRLISFITEPGPIRKIPTHVGEPLEPPPLSPARGPPRCVRIFRIGPGPRTGSPQQPEVATSAKARGGFAHRGSDAGASAAAARDRRAGRGTQTVRVRRRHWLPAARTSAHDPARPSWR